MDKKTARLYDAFLERIFQNGKYLNSKIIYKTGHEMGITTSQITKAINTFEGDELIIGEAHPEGFTVFTVHPKAHNFLNQHNGYTRKRVIDMFLFDTIRFIWIRHWLWFFVAIISVLFNIAGYFFDLW